MMSLCVSTLFSEIRAQKPSGAHVTSPRQRKKITMLEGQGEKGELGKQKLRRQMSFLPFVLHCALQKVHWCKCDPNIPVDALVCLLWHILHKSKLLKSPSKT